METFLTQAHKRIVQLVQKGMEQDVDVEEPIGRFRIDIYLPEYHIGIEVDGPTHSPRKDEERDGELWADYGLPILRLPHNVTLQAANDVIEAFITGHYATIEARKNLWLQKRSSLSR